MKMMLPYAASFVAAALVIGCQTLPPGAEPGPSGTMAYHVQIEASDPGARIEVNGQTITNTPLTVKIFGDPDGTFHDFGSSYFVIRALPLTTNQFVQTRVFGTGRWFGPEDRIPERIQFDMNQKTEPQVPYGAPPHGYPYGAPYGYPYGYPYYWPPAYYCPPPYWGYGYGHYYYHGGSHGLHYHK